MLLKGGLQVSASVFCKAPLMEHFGSTGPTCAVRYGILRCPIRCQALYMLMKESCSLAPRPSYQSLQILLRLTPLCWARVILLSGDLGLAFKECRCGNETIRVGALQITVLLLNPCFCGQHPHRTLWISHGIPPRPPSQSRMLKAFSSMLPYRACKRWKLCERKLWHVNLLI